jgi:hypothetical protein
VVLGHEATRRFDVHVTGIGVVSAQGSGAEILEGRPPRPPRPSPWAAAGRETWCRPDPGTDPALSGPRRWNALARAALAQLDRPPTPRVVVASCNGGGSEWNDGAWGRAFDGGALLAGTAWEALRPPVVSGSCASGLHAVFLARCLLAAGERGVTVLAADALSPSSQANFEALRVLAEAPEPPWQPHSSGFVPGEAAVALRLARDEDGAGESLARLFGPTLAQDFDGSGLRRALLPLSGRAPDLVFGLGTGPFATDAMELDALRRAFPDDVPLATSLAHFGHTLGASGPLSLALALLAARAGRPLPSLCMPAPRAADGRPLWRGAPRPQAAVVATRALSGACAAAAVSVDGAVPMTPDPPADWICPGPAGPLQHPLLRRLAAEAPAGRPPRPPALLVALLDEPLAPPPRARMGGRLLPSAVVEITPGFVPQLVARAWGFAGPALCLVGGAGSEVDALLAACRDTAGTVSVVRLHGGGEDRDVDWHPGV